MKRLKDLLETTWVFVIGMRLMYRIKPVHFDNGRTLNWWHAPKLLLGVAGALFLWPILFSRSRLLRPLRRALLKRAMRDEAKKARRGEAKSSFPSYRVWWEFVEETPWDDVVPVIWAQPSLATQLKTCIAFAEMYLWKARLEEAQAAATLGESMAQEWIRNHPEEARQAFELRDALLNQELDFGPSDEIPTT